MRPSDLARGLFSPIAANYDGPAQVLSLFQYRRWHRCLLDHLQVSGPARVLDMATGTGAIALQLAARPGLQVTAADVSRPMLLQARARARRNGYAEAVDFLECTAEAIPLADEAFDAIIFSYLLRYVSDVPATLRELARVLKPGGLMLSLDFAVPRGFFAYPLWRLYTALVLPLAGAVLSPAWLRVGAFLGGSIRSFYKRWPEEALIEAWRRCSFVDVQSQRLSLGGALLIWGRKGP